MEGWRGWLKECEVLRGMPDMLDGNLGGSCDMDVQIDLVWLKTGLNCKTRNAELAE